jgi:hypothetical protein
MMEEEKLKYKALDDLSNDEIEKVLTSGTLDDIIRLPLSVGMNHHDWNFAQDLCLRLASHSNLSVRANALTGLQYVAMTKGKLEKHLVKPVLINALKSTECEELDAAHVITRINQYVKWKVGLKAIDKLKK